MFERLISLVGEDNFNLFQNKKILLIGVGGVGSYSLEALVRSGFNNITVIDFDVIEPSNLNRQLITKQSNIGKPKVEEAAIRATEINPDINIKSVNIKLDANNLLDILNENYDYVIDACDDINVKFELMRLSMKYNYKLISSMGTANKLHPELLKITTLDKTFNDPLARILRKKVKDAKINKKLYVVSSDELPIDNDKLGTANLVPSAAGLLCASFIINDLVKKG